MRVLAEIRQLDVWYAHHAKNPAGHVSLCLGMVETEKSPDVLVIHLASLDPRCRHGGTRVRATLNLGHIQVHVVIAHASDSPSALRHIWAPPRDRSLSPRAGVCRPPAGKTPVNRGFRAAAFGHVSLARLKSSDSWIRRTAIERPSCDTEPPGWCIRRVGATTRPAVGWAKAAPAGQNPSLRRRANSRPCWACRTSPAGRRGQRRCGAAL